MKKTDNASHLVQMGIIKMEIKFLNVQNNVLLVRELLMCVHLVLQVSKLFQIASVMTALSMKEMEPVPHVFPHALHVLELQILV